MLGNLYLVATPIGNLSDITFRALETLKSADIIACEDTRRARVLLDHYGIRSRLVSYFGAKEKGKACELMGFLREGKHVALISDAGMPGISDPGAVLVREAIGSGVTVIPVPGASAIIAAVAASGLPSERFVFEGFLPRRPSERRARLLELAQEARTLVFYESPGRLVETLGDMKAVMGERDAVIARELTKIHEEFMRGTLGELMERIGDTEPRGEIVILLAGCAGKIDWDKVDLGAYVAFVQERMGIERKTALKVVAQISGVAKSVVYKSSLRPKA